jgi:hypothetical protein
LDTTTSAAMRFVQIQSTSSVLMYPSAGSPTTHSASPDVMVPNVACSLLELELVVAAVDANDVVAVETVDVESEASEVSAGATVPTTGSSVVAVGVAVVTTGASVVATGASVVAAGVEVFLW